MSAPPRILVIAYDFPPHGAIGTMRTLRLVRQLHADGWATSVLTGHPATYLAGTPVEPGLQALVPAGVDVIPVRAVRPFDAFERALRRSRRTKPPAAEPVAASKPLGTRPPSRWVASFRRQVVRTRDLIEAALDIPDKESGWIVPAVVQGLRHMRRYGRPDVIFSSAPPWSGQAVALALAMLSGRPWVADFRDPWARAPWREWRRAFRQRAAAALERRVVNRADAVLFVTSANLTEFSDFYGHKSAAKFQLVPNGCDPAELDSVPSLPPRDQFVLLHAGTLYGARSPLPVIRAVARAIHRGALDPSRFRLRLLGPISLPFDLREECRHLGIEKVVEFVPRVTRSESLSEMKSASALLLIQTGTTVSVPGKAYEYLATGRPVLALSEEGETASLVRASGLGYSVRPDQPIEAIESALLETVALATRPLPPPAAHLFDGRVRAQEASRILGYFARHGRGSRLSAPSPIAASVRATPPEESAR